MPNVMRVRVQMFMVLHWIRIAYSLNNVSQKPCVENPHQAMFIVRRGFDQQKQCKAYTFYAALNKFAFPFCDFFFAHKKRPVFRHNVSFCVHVYAIVFQL